MTSIEESTTRGYEWLGPTLGDALDKLAQDVTFYRYTKLVLPLDGYVFWVRNGEIVTRGVLHYSTERHQDEDQTVAVNDCIFTSRNQVVEFNVQSPEEIYIAYYQPPANPGFPSFPYLRFAFVKRAPLIRQAGVYHYSGHALYSSMATQLIDRADQIDPTKLIVSNSLPAWLALKSYNPVWLIGGNPGITLYPSYAVPDNLEPPYGVVHITPDSIRSMQSAPMYGATGSRYQLSAERVRVILYGCNNDVASDFADLVKQYSEDLSTIGLMSLLPAIRDDKRTQPELAILAQRKTLEFEISYVQSRMRSVARELIAQATATLHTIPGPPILSFRPASLGVDADLAPALV